MKRLFILLNLGGILALGIGIAILLIWTRQIPRLPDDLRLLAVIPPTEIYDRYERLIGSIGGRQYVSIERISPHFLNAIVATEDRHFWQHKGISHLAVLRAIYLNLKYGESAPGGSTITQQLAKNLFFSFRRSWQRKIREAIAAMAIERKFTKEEILEAYCNLVYFGHQAYGIERASQVYFGKHSWQLTLPEAALLAGLPKAPSALDPLAHPEQARRRQITVFRRMAKAGYIRRDQVDSLAALPLNLAHPLNLNRFLFAIDGAMLEARKIVEPELVEYGGLKIYTTIDPELQRIAQNTLSSGLDILESRLRTDPRSPGRLEGALVALEVGSGDILALVGGRNYGVSPFHRALHSRRPPGSAFKPVIYLAALENLPLTPDSKMIDEPVEFPLPGKKTWKPKNFDEKFQGPVTLRFALEWSINTIAAQLTHQLGPERVMKTAQSLGITSPLEPHLSLSLGAIGVTPLEMATVTATIARRGVYKP
ncbi:MAG: transglycosylase domain-containing protein, partial [bacterium]